MSGVTSELIGPPWAATELTWCHMLWSQSHSTRFDARIILLNASDDNPKRLYNYLDIVYALYLKKKIGKRCLFIIKAFQLNNMDSKKTGLPLAMGPEKTFLNVTNWLLIAHPRVNYHSLLINATLISYLRLKGKSLSFECWMSSKPVELPVIFLSRYVFVLFLQLQQVSDEIGRESTFLGIYWRWSIIS